ncbi:MAG: hypothetical protein AMXMBFR4_25760 [Candidatus Hydrogenedentota bacterium]
MIGEEWGEVNLALTDCRAGDECEVIDVHADSQLSMRLREMGMVSGARLRVARGGSPLILEIGEARVCMRGDDAARVRVRLAPPLEFAESRSMLVPALGETDLG